jgi:phosphatidylethanolamine/phosphatidyl-N-methylethanolamine N-methyltransferase
MEASNGRRSGSGEAIGRSDGQSDPRLTFFREFLRRPREIASVVPSSRFLERRVVEAAAVATARLAVELGPGTGGTTAAILRALPADARLLAFEINGQFAALLRSIPDPRLLVHLGSAVEMAEVLAQRGLPPPDVVLSGIPFSTTPPAVGRRILLGAWRALAPGGRLVAYQFRSAVGNLGRDVLGAPEVAMEFLNVPPMRVFSWRKPADGSAAAGNLPQASTVLR